MTISKFDKDGPAAEGSSLSVYESVNNYIDLSILIFLGNKHSVIFRNVKHAFTHVVFKHGAQRITRVILNIGETWQ